MTSEGQKSPLAELQTRLGTVYGLPILEETHLDAALRGEVVPDAVCEAQPCKRCLVPAARLRIAEHLDLSPDLLILEHELGTFGLVYDLSAETKPGLASGRNARALVSQAAYMHYLLATDPDRDRDMIRNVELVLLYIGDDAGFDELNRTLTELSQTTEFLFQVGLHLLRPSGPGPTQLFQDGDLRRAFPWLLGATRAWYASLAAATCPVSTRRLRALTLRDYRIAGERRLLLDPAQRLHLVQGRNGTGKSSIAEAIEYILTGQIERIPDGEDAADVVIHSEADSARVAITWDNGEEEALELERAGRATAGPDAASAPSWASTQADLQAASCRLDQALMDRFTRADDAERARAFLAGYFPEEMPLFQRRNAALREQHRLLQALPPAMRRALQERGEGALPGEDEYTPLQTLELCLPDDGSTLLDMADMYRLGRFQAQLLELLDEERAGSRPITDRLQALDSALAQLLDQAPDILHVLETALPVLEGCRSWRLESTGSTAADPAEALNQSLDAAVLERLVRQRLDIDAVFDAEGVLASELIQLGRLQPASLSLAGTEREALSLVAKLLAERREAHRDEFFAARTAAETDADSPQMQAKQLNPAQVQALNQAGRWLARGRVDEPLGDRLRAAIHLGRADQRFGDIVIGAEGWYAALEPELVELREARDSLVRLRKGRDRADDIAMSTRVRYRLAVDLREQLVTLSNTEHELTRSFLRHIGLVGSDQDSDADPTSTLLNAALNEIMALCTSAGWTYDDIHVRYEARVQQEQGDEAVKLMIGDAVRAELRLNTAELNLFTIAVFLLCAPRVPNPLRLLVLDDPLQNLDEMTSLSLARGLQRLFRLWEPGQDWAGLPDWRVLMLFHGEDDAQRFRTLLPCDAHRLQWLRAGVDMHRLPRQQTLASRYQPLSPQLIKARR